MIQFNHLKKNKKKTRAIARPDWPGDEESMAAEHDKSQGEKTFDGNNGTLVK